MMIDEVLAARRKALEEQFFAQENAKLLENLKVASKTQDARVALTRASGISDKSALDHLIAANLSPETLAAMSVAPLVAVAWADGKIQEREKQAILRAAQEAGILPESAAFQLLSGWLATAPGDRLTTVWVEYVQALGKGLSPAARTSLEESILGRARRVADAAGGFLGAASISGKEQTVLARLKSAFSSQN